MFRLVDRGGCRHQALLRYFDETIEPCGASCDVCRGEGIDALVGVPPKTAAATRRSRDFALAAPDPATRARDGAFGSPEEALRFDRLRAVRKQLADAEGVPAYIVFSDAVLRQMAQSLPRTKIEMLLLSGVGPVKLERYGDAFLEALRGND